MPGVTLSFAWMRICNTPPSFYPSLSIDGARGLTLFKPYAEASLG